MTRDEIDMEALSKWMSKLGRRGGATRSAKKRETSRANLAKANEAKQRLRGSFTEPDQEDK